MVKVVTHKVRIERRDGEFVFFENVTDYVAGDRGVTIVQKTRQTWFAYDVVATATFEEEQ